MPKDLVKTLWSPRPYLHSAVDDLESFYHTAQWAAAFNNGASRGKHDGDDIREFREMISSDKRSDAILMVQPTHHRLWMEMEEEYGAFFTHSTALLGPWLEKLNALTADWSFLAKQAKKLDDTKRKEHLDYNFLVYGYRGVAEYFELLHELRELLEKAV